MYVALAVTAVLLVIEPLAGRLLFMYECRHNEGTWIPERIKMNSLALDDRTNFFHEDGCSSLCLGRLLRREGRLDFVEVLVLNPDPKLMSREPGWHRYYVATKGSPQC